MVEKILQSPELPRIFAQVVENYTAGSLTDDRLKWTGLRPLELRQRLKANNYEVSDYIVHQLLNHAGLSRRSYLKVAATDQVPHRNDQFERIALLKERFLDLGLPVLSIDTPNKRTLGFTVLGNTMIRYRAANDHDFKSTAHLVIPHGIYDVGDNFGYLTLKVRHDTSAFVCDNCFISGKAICNGSTPRPNGCCCFAMVEALTIPATCCCQRKLMV